MSLPTKPTCRHVKKDCQQTSSVSLHPPFVGIPHPFIVSQTRWGSCPPCYRNWVPGRSPSRLPSPLQSKCPCASGRQVDWRWGDTAWKMKMLNPNKMEVDGSDDFPVQLGEFLGFMWIFRDVWSNDIWFDVCICWLGLSIIISSCRGIYLEYHWCDVPCFVRFVMVQ